MTSEEGAKIAARRRLVEKSARSNKSYAEFLPAAVEISVRSAPPVVPILIAVMIASVAAAIAWSAFASLDVYTSAPGRVRASIPPAVIQPVEAGRIADIRVHNGLTVHQGDTLITLDDVEVKAALDAATSGRFSWLGEIERRRSALEAVADGSWDGSVPLFSAQIPRNVVDRETAAFQAELNDLTSSTKAIEAQINEAEARRGRFENVVAAETRLNSLLKEKREMAEALLPSAAGSRASVLASLESEARLATELADNNAQLLETEAAIRSLKEQKKQILGSFVTKQAQGLQVAERQIEQLDQEIVKQSARWEHLSLRAPIDGTVQQLAAAAKGQVVANGQTLAVVVSTDAQLIIEALIPSAEIGFVRVGDEATIKADAFPFTRYGSFNGHVASISREAVTAQNAQALQDAVASASGKANDQPAGVPAVAGLFYIAKIELLDPSITVNGARLNLETGMTVRAEIKTESRKVIDYLLSPVAEVLNTAGHER